MKLFLSAFLLLSASSFGQIFYPAGNANKINGATVPASQPCIGSNSSSQLIAGTCSGSSTLTNTHFFVGNASNVATDVAMSGDASIANTGALTVNPLSLLKGGWTNWVDPKQCDAVHAYCAAGSITTTTGSITTGTPTLTVASATGWTVGMGIGVAGAGAAAAELFTSVTAIAGTTFTLAANASTTATTQTVNHDDTAAVLAAIASGFNIHVTKGNYNVRAATAANIFTISAPVMFIGDGSPNTVFYVRSLNNQVFAVRYFTDSHSILAGATISDISVIQVGTSTAGAAFDVRTGGGANTYVTNLHVDRVSIQNACVGMIVDTGVISNWFTNSYIQKSTCGVQGGGIWIDSQVPSGDGTYQGIEMSGLNTGILINKADTNRFLNNKINGGNIHIAPSCGADCVGNLIFTGNSIEGGTGAPTYAVQIDGGGSTAHQMLFNGNGMGGFFGPFLVTLSANNIISNNLIYNMAGPAITLSLSTASITGNNIKSNAGTAAVLLNTSASAVIEGNTIQTGPTNFISTDASANTLTVGNNLSSSLPNSLGVGTICSTCFTHKVFTVATLPACNSGTIRSLTSVSDATIPTYNGALTGGGAVLVPAYCDGTAWLSH